MVRCRKQHKGKEKVVRARGKPMHRARTAWCTARTALISPSNTYWNPLIVWLVSLTFSGHPSLLTGIHQLTYRSLRYSLKNSFSACWNP